MKKRSIIAILCVSVLALTGCAGATNDTTNTNETPVETTQDTTTEETQEPATESEAQPNTQSTDSNTLIAYFTWGDNTVVEDPDSVDVDATTSASLLPPGNVGLMASWIQGVVGGDLFSIQVEEPYSSDYDECLDRASEENAQDARPALSTHVENMDQYDTIYLGYPNWWYSCPMAILSFIDEYNLEGKQIVLFCSHGTGGLAGSVEAITEELPDSCTISDNVLGVYRPEVAASQEVVIDWAKQVEAEIR